jgi:hypothetical protein
MHSIRHSLLPSKLRSHSSPSPVHSGRRCVSSSTAAEANALMVEFRISLVVALNSLEGSSSTDEVIGVRGWNQSLLKSKKQRSDQLQDVRNKMRSRKLQYMHGRFRKYAQMKKRKMNAGDAFVGMNSNGSQLFNAILVSVNHSILSQLF